MKPRKYTIEQLVEAIKTSFTKKEVCEKLGLSRSGGGTKQIFNNLEEFGLNINHFDKYKTGILIKDIPTNELLCENSTTTRKTIRHRILKEKLIPYICSICGQNDIWEGDLLILQLDHINGISNDNRLENLRFLCPNCDSNMNTYCGKNKRYEIHHKFKNEKIEMVPTGKEARTKPMHQCIDCGKNIDLKRIRCRHCNNSILNRRTKIIWPDDIDLLRLVSESNYVQLGKKLGVSDKAIKNRLRRRGLV